jgi:putative adenylate-forming enzyme
LWYACTASAPDKSPRHEKICTAKNGIRVNYQKATRVTTPLRPLHNLFVGFSRILNGYRFMPSNLLTICRVLWKRRTLERSNSWTRGRLLEHQRAAIAAVRNFAFERSPFYRRFHRDLESRPLADLPVLTKATLMENFDDLVTDRSVRLAHVEHFLSSAHGNALFQDRYVVLATSGSTGLRGVFLFDPAEWLIALASITRPIYWAGARPNPLHPRRAAMIASTSVSHYSARVGLSLASRVLPTLRMDAAESLAGMVERLNQWQPEILAAYPSILRELAEEQIAGRLHIRLRQVASSAEVLTSDVRRRVKQAWDVPMYNTYGATEYAPIAAECEYGRMHLLEDGAFIEVDKDRVLLTVFGRRTQPLIRYEISDVVQSVEGQCQCGRPFQLIEAIEGRVEDVLSLPSIRGAAVSVHPNAFHGVLESIPAAGWQVVQEHDGLHVLLVGLRDPRACDAINSSIRRLLDAHGAAPLSVDVRQVAELRRGATGKAPLVLARRPAGALC